MSVVTPLVVLRLTGLPEWSMFASFGAFASIYGRSGTHLDRLHMQASAGALLVACVSAGAAVAGLPGAARAIALLIGMVAAIASAVSDVLRWRPPGAMFGVFAFGACASAPTTLTQVPAAFAVSVASAAFATLVGASGAAVPTARRPGRTPPALRPGSAVIRRNALAYFFAAGTAVAVAEATGRSYAYWAAVAAVVPLSASGTSHRLTRAWHRALGTALGLVAAAALFATGPTGWAVVGLVALLQVATELFVLRHYAVAMVFVTPMALLMTELGHPQPEVPLILDRGITTLIGVIVGSAVVLAVHESTSQSGD